jgi:hypothetical protein
LTKHTETASTRRSESITDAMVRFFAEDEWAFYRNEGEPILQMGFKGKSGNWTCYAHALDEARRFIFLSVMETSIPEDKRQAVAEFLTRANYALFLGGFEMDFSDGEVRYKTSIAVEDGKLSQAMIKTMVYTNVLSMDRYLPGILSVIYGGISPAHALAQIEQKE